jgi:hypothetical protein
MKEINILGRNLIMENNELKAAKAILGLIAIVGGIACLTMETRKLRKELKAKKEKEMA